MKTELFQLASTGRLKHLVVSVEDNILKTEWWSSKNGMDGKRQKTTETVFGKNEGRANATTDAEQAVLEYERKVRDKREEGYVDSKHQALADVILDITHILPQSFAPSKPISKLPKKADPFDGTWLAERKWNGVCLLIHNTGKDKLIYSRRLLPITDIAGVVPRLRKSLSKVPNESLILGELVAIDSYGVERPQVLRGITSDKTTVEKSKERYDKLLSEGYSVEFHPYTVVFHKGEDVTAIPFTEQVSLIENIFGYKRDIRTFTSLQEDLAKANGWEGFILRRSNDTITYTMNGKPKRQGGYKYKFLETTDCVVVGVNVGAGKHEQRFARFQLAQYEKGKLVGCGWSGGGQLGEANMDEITNNLISKGYKLEETVLDPKDYFAVEIEYQSRHERNSAGELCFEFPIILRMRDTDKPLRECEVDV